MKKLMIITLSIFLTLCTTFAWAEFLASDPPTQSHMAGSQVELNGVWESVVDLGTCTDKLPGCVWTDPATSIEHYIWKDLSTLPDASYTFRGRWIDVFGREGDISDPFVWNKGPLPKPGLRIIP